MTRLREREPFLGCAAHFLLSFSPPSPRGNGKKGEKTDAAQYTVNPNKSHHVFSEPKKKIFPWNSCSISPRKRGRSLIIAGKEGDKNTCFQLSPPFLSFSDHTASSLSLKEVPFPTGTLWNGPSPCPHILLIRLIQNKKVQYKDFHTPLWCDPVRKQNQTPTGFIHNRP